MEPSDCRSGWQILWPGVVFTIAALVQMALVTAVYKGGAFRHERSPRRMSQLMAEEVNDAAQTLVEQNHVCPTRDDVAAWLARKSLRDLWGNAFQITCVTTDDRTTLVVGSAGPDKTWGAGDETMALKTLVTARGPDQLTKRGSDGGESSTLP